MRPYFEDINVGDKTAYGRYEVTEAELLEFAERYDPQRFHVDRAYAEEKLGGLIASGWHTCAMFMRMMVEASLGENGKFPSPGVDELRWRVPVRPGDVLSVRGEVIEKRPSRSKPDRGIVRSRQEVVNQDGVVVMSMITNGFVERRGSEEAAE